MSLARLSQYRLRCSTIRVTIGIEFATAVLVQSADCFAQQDQFLELEWDAPPNCPQPMEVKEQVRKLLGTQEGSELPSHLRAKGTVELASERYQLTLLVQVGTTKGTRVIASEDCNGLGKAAAVVLGLLIRKERKLGRELSAGELSLDFPQPSTSTEASVSPSVEPSRAPWHLLVRIPIVQFDYWTLPDPSFGLGLAAGVAHAGWRVMASGSLWLSQTRKSAGVLPYEANYRRKSVEVLGCRAWLSAPFEVAPCALVALDVVNARASGDHLSSKSEGTTWASVGGGIVGFWHLSQSASLFLSATGRVMTHRPVFVVEGLMGADRAHAVPAGSLQTSIGGEWSF